MCIFVKGHNAENIVVLVNRLAEVTSLLFIPPVAIGITMLAILAWRVYVATIL
jgi:hypothetical protein